MTSFYSLSLLFYFRAFIRDVTLAHTCRSMQLCNYFVGENVSVLSEPIRSSDPYKQCLDCSVGHERLDTETNLIEGAETKFGLLIRERPQGGRSCRGLLQVWVIKVELFVPLLEQQRLTTTTGRFHTLFYLPPKGEYQIPCEQDRRRLCWIEGDSARRVSTKGLGEALHGKLPSRFISRVFKERSQEILKWLCLKIRLR